MKAIRGELGAKESRIGDRRLSLYSLEIDGEWGKLGFMGRATGHVRV